MEAKEYLDEGRGSISKSKCVWQIILDVILFATLFFIILKLISIPLTVVLKGISPETIAANIPVYILYETLMLVSAFLSAWIVLNIRKLPLTGLGFSFRGRSKDLVAGMLLVLVMYGVGFGLSLALGVVQVVDVVFHPSSLLITLSFFFLVAVTEELIVRGFILGRMLDGNINKFGALLISSILFSLMHAFNPNFALVPFFNIVLAGIFLGASYIYTRNLCFPIALHWFWNWLQGPVLGYKVSGSQFGEGLFTLQLPSPNLLNGGTFGFEGSILCSVLLIVGTVSIIGYYSRK